MTRALAFHVESIHDEHTWRRLQAVLKLLRKCGSKVTFFVYPYRSHLAGYDITERVKTLASLGHEIGQHTHFYAGDAINRPNKRNDLSDRNIRACITRDFEWIQGIVKPAGFTAGGWLLPAAVFTTLVDLGFEYDCSSRFPRSQAATNPVYERWQSSAQLYRNGQGQLALLPTTCSLGEWFKRPRVACSQGSQKYQLIYLHDYDLVTAKSYLAARLYVGLHGARLITVGDMTRRFCDLACATG